MAYKSAKRAREKAREYNAAHREKQRLAAKQRYQERSKFLQDYQSEQGCKRCGEARWYMLDFHHRDPSTKEFNISTHWSNGMDRILAEIEKCDVLCKNCHAEVHHEMRLAAADQGT